jgi:hypothetical protein
MGSPFPGSDTTVRKEGTGQRTHGASAAGKLRGSWFRETRGGPAPPDEKLLPYRAMPPLLNRTNPDGTVERTVKTRIGRFVNGQRLDR